MVSVPWMGPVTSGAKLTSIVQLWPVATGCEQVFPSVKLWLTAILVTERETGPVFVTVTVCAALTLLTACPLNVRAEGVRTAFVDCVPDVSKGTCQIPRP